MIYKSFLRGNKLLIQLKTIETNIIWNLIFNNIFSNLFNGYNLKQCITTTRAINVKD